MAYVAKPDLTDCDREPIHLLGGVQGYGCLISTSFDFLIKHVSTNVAELLKLDPGAVVGRPLPEFFPERIVHMLRSNLQFVSPTSGVTRVFACDVLGRGALFDLSIHISGQSYVFEFEPRIDNAQRDQLALIQPLLARVKRAASVLDVCRETTAALQALSGFDRVMVYQFAPDGAGEVIAERHGPEMEPLLGLRYPASDIPQQARALYKRSLLRLIADVDGPIAPLVPPTDASGAPLDLSLSVTRAVSAIHLEYLRNMGVAASMSVSILKDGELWGLIICHHQSPRYVAYQRRTAIELLVQFFSYELAQRIERASQQDERAARQLHDRLMIGLSAGASIIDGFERVADKLFDLIPADGIAIYVEGRYAARGAAPSEAGFLALAAFLNTAPTGQIIRTDRLSEFCPGAGVLSEQVAGLMAIPISRAPRDYIVFFRKELVRSVTWAGNPDKSVETDGERLTPRKSFATWKETVRGASAPWSEREQRVGEALRLSLMEIILKLADEANLERKKAAEKQELLIAELNHRVRNILNLIRGLVSQSRSGAADIASYTQVLDGRIQSLARAHDQLTRRAWSPVPLLELIDTEMQAFLGAHSHRLKLSGAAPMLSPQAFSTMALVVHELVTNAAKYGALNDNSGTVSVDMRIAAEGSLTIAWRERGGPPVQAPTRQGFGATIIEKTIPYELGGMVDTRYMPAGFEADLTIPARFVSAVATDTAPDQPVQEQVAVEAQAAHMSHALIVEDNMIAALDAADILRQAGATTVHTASTVTDALALIDRYPIGFALLDVNLGDRTSLPVAERLASAGVVFILVTGYGDAARVLDGYPPARVISKPFTEETLLKNLREALAAAGQA